MRSAAAAAIAVVLALVAIAAPSTPARAAPSTPARAAPSADDLLARAQAYYKKIDHLRGSFRQETSSATRATTRKSHGAVMLARDGKLRFDYAPATGAGVSRSVRSDGGHLWEIDHDRREVVIADLSKDPLPIAIAALTGGDPVQGFTASLTTTSGFGDADHPVVQLDARQAGARWKRVFLIVAASDGHVTESVVVDASGNVTHLLFDKLDPRAKVNDSDFVADLESKALKDYKRVDAGPATDR